MIRIFKHKLFYCAAILVILFAACSSDGDSPTPPPPARPAHTLVAYMMVDGLDSYIKKNVSDIIESSKQITTNENILIFLDYANSNSYILKIANGKADTVKTYNQNLINADPEVMTNVLQWCFNTYPADNYGLIFGSHGSSWMFSNDTIPVKGKKKHIGASYGKDKPINIPTFANVLSTLPHQQFILLDLCAGQSVEIAYEIRHSTDFIIGSPAEIPDSGAQFKVLLPYMLKDDPIEIGRRYYEYYATKNPAEKPPISVIRTSELENLAQATKQNLHFISADFPTDASFKNLIYYFTRDAGGRTRPICYDMNHIMQHFLPTNEYESWKAQFDRAVVFKGQSSRWVTIYPIDFKSFTVDSNTYGGVSMFVPATIYASLNEDYKKLLWYNTLYK